MKRRLISIGFDFPGGVVEVLPFRSDIQEDFAREGVKDYARGILFGNGQRLVKPEERTEHFTEKCLAGARRSGISLVRTIAIPNDGGNKINATGGI